MNKIRPWLYISKYSETRAHLMLKARGISAMLQLAELVEHPGIESCYLAVEDGLPLPDKILKQGTDFVIAQKEQGGTILIACGAGISRSAAFAIAALKETEGLTLLDAFHEVRQARPESLPHMALWASLCQYYGESIDWLDLI